MYIIGAAHTSKWLLLYSKAGHYVLLPTRDEYLIDDILPQATEAKSALAPVINTLEGATKRLQLQQDLIRTHLTAQLGDRLLDSIAEAIGPNIQERARMAQMWDGIVRLQPAIYAQTLTAITKFLAIDSIRITSAADIIDGLVPSVIYDNQDAKLKFNLKIKFTAAGVAQLRDFESREYSLSDFNLAFPIHRDPLPNGDTWKAAIDKLLRSTAEKTEGIANFKGEFPVTPTTVGEVAFLPLHEIAELALVQALDIREPLARWFHDGMANYLALEAIRNVLGQDAYDHAPYSPGKIGQFEDKKAAVNLLAWPRADIENYKRNPISEAHYFYATQEIADLARQHGRLFINQLLSVLKSQRPVDTDKICAVVKQMTGEDLLSRLQSAYASQSDRSIDGVELEAEDRWEQQDYEGVIPRLESLVRQLPREADFHYRLSVAYLNIDADKNREAFLYHYLIYAGLQRSRGFPVQEPELLASKVSAPAFYALGQLCEAQDYVEGAKDLYQKAIELNPQHEPSLNRLTALRSGVAASTAH
jgi:tetratricopeptide (TPR) repeat protein